MSKSPHISNRDQAGQCLIFQDFLSAHRIPLAALFGAILMATILFAFVNLITGLLCSIFLSILTVLTLSYRHKLCINLSSAEYELHSGLMGVQKMKSGALTEFRALVIDERLVPGQYQASKSYSAILHFHRSDIRPFHVFEANELNQMIETVQRSGLLPFVTIELGTNLSKEQEHFGELALLMNEKR